jgi:hypothetical protein
MDIVQNKLDHEMVESNQSEIDGIESMYKNVTSLVFGLEKTIKQASETQKVSEDLKLLDKEKSNYKIADDVITIFKKLNSNTEENLELMHSLTKNNVHAREIHILSEISEDVVNSEFIVAKENCINIHKEFLQRLEIEFEDTLLGIHGFDQRKLKIQIGVFETLKHIDTGIKIYVDFF